MTARTATGDGAVADLVAAVRADPGLLDEAVRRLPRRTKLALAVEVVPVYVRVRVLLRRHRLPGVLAALRDGVRDRGVAACDAAEEHVAAVRVGRAVARTLRPLPGDTRCLTQSLVLTALLARRGIGTTLIIAVAPGGEEFLAHAWVEHGGVALLPPGEEGFGRMVEL